MARTVLNAPDNEDGKKTRKIESFVPRYGRRTQLVFQSVEEALQWAAEKLGLKGAA